MVLHAGTRNDTITSAQCDGFRTIFDSIPVQTRTSMDYAPMIHMCSEVLYQHEVRDLVEEALERRKASDLLIRVMSRSRPRAIIGQEMLNQARAVLRDDGPDVQLDKRYQEQVDRRKERHRWRRPTTKGASRGRGSRRRQEDPGPGVPPPGGKGKEG